MNAGADFACIYIFVGTCMQSSIYEHVYHPHQKTAQALLQLSDVLNQIYLDQWHYLAHVTAQNMLEIDTTAHILSFANGLIKLHFSVQQPLLRIEYAYPDKKYDKLTQFLLREMPFFTGNFASQHPTTVKTRSQVLRQTLIEQVFEWIQGEDRIERFIYNISLGDAEAIDELLISENYYHEAHLTQFAKYGIQVPLEVELNLKHLCLVNSVQGEYFIQVNALVQHYDRMCYSANRFMPQALYRIMEITFVDQFHLEMLLDQQDELQILIPHAIQYPHLLGFSRLMQRGCWQNQDIFSKHNFLQKNAFCWDEMLLKQSPVAHYSRTVNWLFKQDALVNDWISQQINHPSIRITMVALSFNDCSAIHSQVMLQTLRYFRGVAARLFLGECHEYAKRHHWFDPINRIDVAISTNNSSVVNQDMPTQEITHSILYIEEWLNLLQQKSQSNPQVVKQVYLRLSRVIQAYMRFLQQLSLQLPKELIPYIDPNKQQQPEFFYLLKQYKLKTDDFRQLFRHPSVPLLGSISVFSSDVADYLLEYFQQRRDMSKNVTWTGLFAQSCRWHIHLRRQQSYQELRGRVQVESWQRVSPMPVMYFSGWSFKELHSLDDIVEESMSFKHCLAVSYTERIVEHEYVAFHMQHLHETELSLTLGCHFNYGRLEFDQVRLQNNIIPDYSIISSAQLFVDELNDYLRLESYNPEVASLDRFKS